MHSLNGTLDKIKTNQPPAIPDAIKTLRAHTLDNIETIHMPHQIDEKTQGICQRSIELSQV